jgi:hypothetical protein
VTVPLADATSTRLDADLERIGGSYSWYGLTLAWRVRALIGRVVGEYWKLSSPQEIVQGAAVDWWLVVRRDPGAARVARDPLVSRRSMARLWMH